MPGERARRRYNRDLIIEFVAYAALLALTVWVVNANPDAAWRWVVAPLPMIPAAFMVVTEVRLYRDSDELQQRISLEALAFAFAGTALVTFTYGFLDAAGLHRISWWWVWPVMATLWIIGGVLARKRWL